LRFGHTALLGLTIEKEANKIVYQFISGRPRNFRYLIISSSITQEVFGKCEVSDLGQVTQYYLAYPMGINVI
jgi:hypothetical protein